MSLRAGAGEAALTHPQRRRLLAKGIGVLTASFFLYLTAVVLADPLLTVRSPVEKADAILVLGGDGPRRAARAAELWLQELAPRIIVAGDGDCLHIRNAMADAGVDADMISVECLSRNTWENALNAAPLLQAAQAREVVLVTSWFHTRRATQTLRMICPGIVWRAMPTEPSGGLIGTAFSRDGLAIVYEYIKLAAYSGRGVLSPPGRPLPGAACVQASVHGG